MRYDFIKKLKKYPARGVLKKKKEEMWLASMFFIKVLKEVTTFPPLALFGKTNIQTIIFPLWKRYVVLWQYKNIQKGRHPSSSSVVRRRPSSSVAVRRRPSPSYMKLYKGPVFQKQRPFSQGGRKRVNPTMTISMVTGRRKGDPQHYVEGINDVTNNSSPSLPKQCSYKSMRNTP